MCLDCLFWCLDLVFGFDCGFSGFGVGDLFLVYVVGGWVVLVFVFRVG